MRRKIMVESKADEEEEDHLEVESKVGNRRWRGGGVSIKWYEDCGAVNVTLTINSLSTLDSTQIPHVVTQQILQQLFQIGSEPFSYF